MCMTPPTFLTPNSETNILLPFPGKAGGLGGAGVAGRLGSAGTRNCVLPDCLVAHGW